MTKHALTARFGPTVRRLRLDSSMSQQLLAWAVQVHRSAISKLESGVLDPQA
jgi:DNA-binding XRE family transcriptional regulator